MKGKLTVGGLLFATGFAVAAASAAIPEVITYHGRLAPLPLPKVLDANVGTNDGYLALMDMTFALYDSAVSNAAPAWARTVGNVRIESNGFFYVELSNDLGSNALTNRCRLSEALAGMKGVPEIGLRLGRDLKDVEMKPRQRLTTSVRAARAARTRIADRFVAERGISFPTLQTEVLAASQLSVAKQLVLGGRCTLTTCPERRLGGKGSELTVCGVRTWRDPGDVRASMVDTYAIGSAPHDMVLTYEDKGETYTVIVPRGGKVTAQPGTVNSVVAATEFGK